MSRYESNEIAEEPQIPHVPGGFGGPVPPVAKGAGFDSRKGTTRGALNSNRSKRRVVISRPPLILNVRLQPLEPDALNLLELADKATQFDSIAVTKVTRNLEVRPCLRRPRTTNRPGCPVGRPGAGEQPGNGLRLLFALKTGWESPETAFWQGFCHGDGSLVVRTPWSPFGCSTVSLQRLTFAMHSLCH